MFRIRYYNQFIHPDHFKNSGLSGIFIITLNWFRWKLETVIQLLVLKWSAKKGSLPKSQVSEYLRTFKLDVQAEKIEKEQTSPIHEKVEIPKEVLTRADRYVDGGVKTALESEALPQRPAPLDNLVAMYSNNIRAKRYTKGFKFQVTDPDGDFEPLEFKNGLSDSGSGGSDIDRVGGVWRSSRILENGESDSGT